MTEEWLINVYEQNTGNINGLWNWTEITYDFMLGFGGKKQVEEPLNISRAEEMPREVMGLRQL